MKRLKYITVIALALLLFNTSCESFLEEVPMDEISVDYIYANVGGLEVGLNALYNRQRYNNFPGGEGDGLKVNAFFYCATDLGMTRTWHRPYGSGHTAASYPARKWTVSYEIIDRANAIIIAAEGMEEDARLKKVVAETKAIRAEIYLDLIRMYGNILLDVTATTPENYQDSVVYEAANPADVFALIDSDLDYAIANLDFNSEYGRYGQGVARHLRGKSAMWQSKWSEAAEQFDAIINDGTHYLVGLNQVFGQNLNHGEALFVYTRDQLLGASDNLAGGQGTWIGSMFNNRAYEMGNGEIIASVEYGGQALGWSFPNSYLQSLYDQENDARYTTYYYPLTKYCNVPGNPNFGNEISSYDDNFRRHHFSLKKFHDEDKVVTTNDSWKDIMYYRFAETLLLSAEAHWRMDNENPQNAKALEYINMIRERAYGDSNHNYTEFTLDNYLDESARELAFEKNRWFLLKRMGLLVERQSMYYQYGSNSGNVVVEPMQPYMVNFPVPQSQIDLMGNPAMQADGY